MIQRLYDHRFEIFFFSLITILFGVLIFPKVIFSAYVMPALFLINISAGFLIFKKRKQQSWLVIVIFVLAFAIFVYRFLSNSEDPILNYIKFFVYFLFYTLVTFEIIKQVWSAQKVNKTVIFGLMSGYLALGFIGFFVFNCIELVHPDSFNGLTENGMTANNIDDLMYYSYISLMTIGYGDITPSSDIAQKATMFVALVGQFYMVIITAVVVEKYIRHSVKE